MSLDSQMNIEPSLGGVSLDLVPCKKSLLDDLLDNSLSFALGIPIIVSGIEMFTDLQVKPFSVYEPLAVISGLFSGAVAYFCSRSIGERP